MSAEKPLPFARKVGDLIVYQRQRQLARNIFELTKRFPKEERYSLTDQIRRSSRSIGAQIAEAWGKRDYERHFVSKLTDADAEQLETRHWIETSGDCGYLQANETSALLSQCAEIGRMLESMKARASLFCCTHANSVREGSPDCEFNIFFGA